MPAIPIIAAVIGGGAAIAGANTSADAAKKAATTAAGYQPQYAKGIDSQLYDLMNQQAGMANPYGADSQYSGIANSLMGQYSNMSGQSYTLPGTTAPDVTTQSLNPAYTAWQTAQTANQGQGGWQGRGNHPNWGNNSNPAPAQYLSTTTPGAYTPGQTVNPTGPNYSDLLNQYLTGAFDNNRNDVYQNLLQNTQQDARSAATARGLNTSPYGAGLENNAVRQMNLSWANDAQNRQSTALQNYLSGQTGLQGLGQNALSTANALEQLKKGWNQQDISNMLNYLGRAQGNVGAAGQIQMQAGQQSANQWSQLQNQATQYAVNAMPSYQGTQNPTPYYGTGYTTVGGNYIP